MELDRFISEAVGRMKDEGRYCGQECPAGNGVCVGRAKADERRPIVVMGLAGHGQSIADLTQADVDNIPASCPYFPASSD